MNCRRIQFFSVTCTCLYFPLKKRLILTCIILALLHSNVAYDTYKAGGNGYHRHLKVLDREGNRLKLLVEWKVDFEREVIIFDLTAWTTGYVGFGLKRPSSLSKTDSGEEDGGGGMAHSDIVIGGIHPNGTSYFKDYHGIGNLSPIQDLSQDWDLLAAYQNTSHTFLRFSRLFDTCDDKNDVRIQRSQSLQILWAIGDTDQITYHGVDSRAIIEDVVLVTTEPEMPSPLPPPQEQIGEMMKDYPSWKTMVNVEMKEAYAYRCTFHRGPRFYRNVHAVGFTPFLDDPNASRYVHHLTFYQCKAPKYSDADQIFEPLVALKEGTECYSPDETIPVHLCMQVLYVWGPGEKGMSFPEQAGILLENGDNSPPVYLMMEVHYENPGEQFTGVKFNVGIQTFYTEQLRQYTAGFLGIGHAITDSLFIPPYSEAFKIEGRCSSECTDRNVPNEGLTVISVMLHAHQYARKIKLRHFRNGIELPWLAVENKFSFKSQKMRRVSEGQKISPGDSLVVECEYDTLSRKTVITGAFSSTGEMCTAFLWYFPKINWNDCSSEFPLQQLHSIFRYQSPVQDYLWNDQMNVQQFPNFSSFIDQNVKWTRDLHDYVQEELIISLHHANCIASDDPVHNFEEMVAEPIVIDPEMRYMPPEKISSSYATNDVDNFRCGDKDNNIKNRLR